MLETLKKTIFAGVGATVMSADAVKNTLADLVTKGKLSAEDAKSAFDKAAARGEEDIMALYEKATTRGKETLESITSIKGAEAFAVLEKRIGAIEEKLGLSATINENNSCEKTSDEESETPESEFAEKK